MSFGKKILSVVMAIVMLVACFAVSTSAYQYNPENKSGEVVISVVADKTVVKRGDIVTFQVCIDTGSKYNMGAIGSLVCFNGSQLSPVGTTIPNFRTYTNAFSGFANQSSMAGNLNFPVSNPALANNFTAEEKAYFTAAVMFQGGSTSSANRWDPSVQGEAYATYQLKVSDSVNPGDEIWVGHHEAGFKGNIANVKYYNDGTKALTVPMSDYNLTNSMVKLTVASDGPAVAKSKAEVKMTPNAEKTAVEEAFSFRVTSVITDADWDTYFKNSADASATTDAIKSVGFVAYKGTTGFNLDTAKAVAQGIPAEGYDVATTSYIQKVDDASDAYFGCRLNITSAATRSDVTYVAFVEYVDGTSATQYAFYEAEQTALLDSNYEGIVNTYLNAIKGA